MKKSVLLLFAALALNTVTQAQDNIVKMNLTSLAFLNFSFQGEHVLNDNSSISLGISFLPSFGLPSSFNKSDGTTNSLADLAVSGFAITPEYRYYFSGKAPQGFYVAPYVRYSKYTIGTFDFEYD